MFCPQCGQENEQGVAFCSRCGYRFQIPQLKPRVNYLIVGILVAIIVVALGIGLYFLIGSIASPPQITELNLSQLVPSNCGFYLSFTSDQKSFLELLESLQIPSIAPGFENPFKELEADQLEKQLLSVLKPNIQLAAVWNREEPDFYLQVEVEDPAQAENVLKGLEDKAKEQGKRVEEKRVGDILVKGWVDDEVWLTLKGKVLYAASSEEALLALFKKNPSSLENNSLFRSVKEEVPKNSSLFVFANFSLMPDIPPEVSHFYLFAGELNAQPHFRGELSLDLEKLLSHPPSKELRTTFEVLSKFVNSPAKTETPFKMAPADSAVAITSFGWLGELFNSLIATNLGPLPPLDLSFLNGEMELYMTVDSSGVPYPFSLTFELNQQSYLEATETLKQLEQLLSQGAGEEFSFETVQIDGVLARKISTSQGDFYYALTEKHLLITTSAESLESLIKREKGLETALGGEEQFKLFASALGKYHLFFYLNGEKIQELMEKLEMPALPALPSSQLKGVLLFLMELAPDSVRFEGTMITH